MKPRQLFVCPDLPEDVVSVVAARGEREAYRLIQRWLREVGEHEVANRDLRVVALGVSCEPRWLKGKRRR